MLDLGFAIAYIALLVFSLVIARSFAITSTVTLATVGISGAALQFLGVGWHSLSLRGMQLWLLATLLVVALACWRLRGRARWSRSTLWVVAGSSAVVAFGFIVTRLLAPGAPGPLTSVGYLISRSSAEDNAKWLNTAASLADGSQVTSWANVGGPLVLVLTLCATLLASISMVLYGGVNEVAVSGGTLILAESLLIVLAPFALTPIIEHVLGKRYGRARVPWPASLLSVAILTSCVMVLLTFGHLTLEYTLLALTVWVGVFLAPVKGVALRTMASLGAATTAMVWFPLNVVAAVILLALIAVSLRGLIRGTASTRNAWTLGITVVVGIFMVEFLGSSIRYALGVDAPVARGAGFGGRGIAAISTPTLPLFNDPGGTQVLTTIMVLLLAVSIIGAVILRDGDRRLSLRAVVPYLPIIALLGYAALISTADFWAVGDGPNYASLKMVYAAGVPALVTTLPFALLALNRPAVGMTMLRWAAVVIVIALLTFDTLFPRAAMQLKPGLWPSTAGAPYWGPAEVQATANQPLSGNPIGCIVLPQGAEKPTVLPNGQSMYACTRLLTGVAGLDVPAAGFVKWQLDEWLQNTSLWDHYHQYLEQLDPSVLSRRVIVLDADKRVIGLETLGGLLERFPAQPDKG